MNDLLLHTRPSSEDRRPKGVRVPPAVERRTGGSAVPRTRAVHGVHLEFSSAHSAPGFGRQKPRSAGGPFPWAWPRPAAAALTNRACWSRDGERRSRSPRAAGVGRRSTVSFGNAHTSRKRRALSHALLQDWSPSPRNVQVRVSERQLDRPGLWGPVGGG